MSTKGIRATGIVRHLDGQSRIVLPKSLRDMMDIHHRTRFEFLTAVLDGSHAIVLRKFDPETFGRVQP